MDQLTEQYLQTIKDKLQLVKETRLTGNVHFQVNTKDGGIGNMTITVTQSYKHDNK